MLLVTAYSHNEALRNIDIEIDGLLSKPTTVKHIYAELAGPLGLTELSGLDMLARRAGDHVSLAPFRGADILLVEDVDINQEVMTELLENAELRVRIANNGEEALRAVAEKIPDCVLMDCQMPVMDGYEATRRLRQDPRYRDLPIIAITANAMASDRERCITAGMNAHIAKPINIPEMFETLAKWMKPVARVAAPLTRNLEAISEITELPVLPGIDAAVGLTQVGGRIPLYCKVLKKFRDNQGRRFEAEFRHLVASGAWADATRMAHSIKGVSRTLGAHNLGELAADLEAASRDQDLAPVEASLARLLAEMARVMVGLERIM